MPPPPPPPPPPVLYVLKRPDMAVHGRAPPWASYQIRKIAGWTCAGNAGDVFPTTDFKGNRLLAIPACFTARALYRTCRDACRDRLLASAGKTFPAHAQPTILRIRPVRDPWRVHAVSKVSVTTGYAIHNVCWSLINTHQGTTEEALLTDLTSY